MSSTYFAGAGTPNTLVAPGGTVQLPTSWVAGDVAFLHANQGGTNAAITAPAGWTLLARVERTSTHVAHLWYRVLQAGDTAPTFAFAGASVLAVRISTYAGLDATLIGAGYLSSMLATGSGASTTGVTTQPTTTGRPADRFVTFLTTVGVSSGADLRYNGQYPAYGDTAGSPLSSAWIDMPLNSQRSLEFGWSPASPYIQISLVLPPSDTTVSPPVGTLLEAYNQDPLRRADAPVINPSSDVAGYLVVEAFNPSPYDQAAWDVSYWNVDTWAGPGRWEDISDRVRGMSWNRGTESPLDRPRVGTATIALDNRDGAVSPWTSGGEFSLTVNHETIGPTWLQPGALVRFGAYYETAAALDASPEMAWKPFFTGAIETMVEGTEQNTDSWVTLGLVETTARLGAVDKAQQAAQGAGDTLTQRIDRLLTDADWQAGFSVLADSIGDVATFQATTMAQNRLSDLYLTVDSVGMRLLAASNGALIITPPYPDVDVISTDTFSNAPEGAELPVVKVQPYSSTDRIINVATAANAGSTEQTFRDQPSIDLFGQNGPGARDDLILQDDATLLEMLQRLVVMFATDSLGIEAIEIDVDQDPANLPLLLGTYASEGLETRTPFHLRWVHPSGNVFPVALVIEGMKHTITPTEPGAAVKWTATLSTATRVLATSAVWDVDFWDTNVWAFAAP